MNKLMGIDYGTKRIGIAISDDEGIMAFPKAVFENNGSFFDKLSKLIDENDISGIVVGESVDYKMKPNVVMKEINSFCDKLKEKFDVPVYLEPEFLTSHQAHHIQGKTEMLDASAAAIILQSYIDKQT
ncbi:Holliday junction resolvase RuvX [Patescibacteria group bacterium]